MDEISQEGISKIIEIAGKRVPSDGKVPPNLRMQLMEALAKLKMDFQTPIEGTIEMASGDMRGAMVRLAIDLGIFNAMAGGKQVSLADLVESSKAASQLIVRLMRFLSTIGVVKQVKQDAWISSPIANAWTDGSPLRDILVHFQEVGRVVTKLPEYLRKTGYREPRDYHDGPFQDTYVQDFWTWLVADTERHSTFNRFMVKNNLNDGEKWYEIYPTDKLIAVNDPSRPLLVDVGGGVGFSIMGLKAHNPKLEGKLILQDLPEVISEARVRAEASPSDYQDMEMMAHNFFTEQPVKDARAYYLRQVLHDWPDASALQILASVRAAMPSNAVLLVNEWIMPDEGAPLFAVWMDMQMMTMFSAWERTRTQWLGLFEEAGFELLEVYAPKEVGAGAGFVFELKPKFG